MNLLNRTFVAFVAALCFAELMMAQDPAAAAPASVDPAPRPQAHLTSEFLVSAEL